MELWETIMYMLLEFWKTLLNKSPLRRTTSTNNSLIKWCFLYKENTIACLFRFSVILFIFISKNIVKLFVISTNQSHHSNFKWKSYSANPSHHKSNYKGERDCEITSEIKSEGTIHNLALYLWHKWKSILHIGLAKLVVRTNFPYIFLI